MKVGKLLVASIAFSLLTASIGAIATESQECHELRKINKYLLSLKGLGYPPCWLSNNNKVEYLFDIVIKKNSTYEVKKANWSVARTKEAMTIPGVADMVRKGHLTQAEFKSYSKMIMSYSDQTKPMACRHFVIMKNERASGQDADVARKILENYFYKYEK